MTHFENEEHQEETKHHEHHEETKHSEHHEHKRTLKLSIWKTLTIILAVLLVTSIYYNFSGSGSGSLSKDEAQTKAMAFINTQLLQGRASAQFNSITEEAGLYTLKFTLNGQEITSYLSKKGDLLFPQGYNLNEKTPASAPSTPSDNQPAPQVTKSDKPKVELFIMSYCPYGTQAEKGFVPAVKALGDKIDASVKFVHYTMHGEKEDTENFRQICIRQDQSAKLWDYLNCFLEDGNADRCLTKTNIDKTSLTACMTNKVKDYYAADSKLSQDYGVQGSPTLVINGAQVDSGRSPSAMLNSICAAFNTKPSECNQALSTASPSPGFGTGTASASANGGCASA